MTAAAVVALGLAAGVAVGGRSAPHALRLRLALGERSRVSGAGRARDSGERPSARGARAAAGGVEAWKVRVVLVVGTLAASAAVGSIVGPAGAVGAAVAVPVVRWFRRRWARDAARRARSAAVADACLVIGSELAAGCSAHQAMNAAAHDWPELFGPAAGRLTVGDDPVPALRAVARHPGAEAMVAVAAAWEVAERSGARAAVVLRAVADTIRDEATVRHEAEAQLSTVRTTARMLTALPVVTLVVFSGGLEPIRFLFRNPYGLACLAGAAVLLGAGLAWVGVVRRQAVRSVWER